MRGEIKLWSFTGDPLAVADYGPLESKDGKRQFVIDTLRPNKDFLVARDGVEMTRLLRLVRDDPGLRRSLARSGLERIRARHTCGHRADELLDIVRTLQAADRPGEDRLMETA